MVGFVNRRSEWRALDLAFAGPDDGASPRLAVVTGTGGVGKTSLAVRWARENAAAFPDGQLFVDLQGFDTRREPMAPESALHTFLLALGADPAALPGDLNALTGMYRSALDGRRVLVVADNARSSDQVRPLLPPGPAGAALVTSRSGLAGILTDHGARLYAADLGRRDPLAGTAARRLLQHYLDGADTSTAGPEFVSVEAPSMVAAVDLAIGEGYDALGCDLAAALEAHLSSRGCWRDLVRVNTSAAAGARRRNDPGRLVRALVGLGRGRIGLRQFDGASIDLELALQIAGDLPASGLLAMVHRALGRLAAHQNRPDQALPHDERALELHLAMGNLTGQATEYNAIGWHQAHLGEPERGLENCRRALAIFVETGNCSGQAMTLDSVGFALALLGRHAEAQDCYLRSARLAAQLGSQVARADTMRRLAHSYLRTGRPAEARFAEREAAEALRLTGRLGTAPDGGVGSEMVTDAMDLGLIPVDGDTFRAAVGIIAS